MQATITTTSMNTNSRNSFVTSIKNQEDQLINSTKCQIVEAKEENERLKWMLSKTMKDYKSLQMHFQGIITQNSNNIIAKSPSNIIEKEEVEHLSLSLGRSSSCSTSKEFKKELYDQNDECKSQKNCKLYDGLDLGLDCKFSQDHLTDDHSPENSFEESNKENIKMARISRNHDEDEDEDEDEDFWDKKKARVSIRAVCGTTTMNDGCQWRKYGQKIAKGNPCPRAYYRCTVSPTCPVRKQVQRCCEDMSILITTYEGTHNHSLPFSATAMASTTSAAASMLRCTSSSTSPLPQQSGLPNVNQNLHGKFNFTNSNSNNLLPTYNNNASTFYLPPKTSISTCQSHPTITLDFTTNTSLSSTHHTLISSQRYPSNSLKFSTPISPSTSSAYLGRPCFSHQPLMITSKNNQNTIEYSGEVRISDD
ncbi:hypothetical protein FXO38_21854 [Capsicum annuum]|nr:hypothetical protein FXO38_21854 [Capsicum annuum]